MARKKEKLTQREKKAQDAFLANLKIAKRKTAKPVIVAMIGLVGSGKSSVAKEIAGLIGANVIEGDAVCVLLRKQGEGYENERHISENIALEILKRGGNVVLDSDFIDPKKRASLAVKARKAKAQVFFVCVYADLDVMIGRVITASYRNSADDFFGGASSKWGGKNKGAVVKSREMTRRLPHHYRWENKGGGRWIIKKPPCKVLADINTADPNWKTEVKKAVQKLL